MSENKKQLKDKNNQNINPITASDAVLRDDGSTVEDFIEQRQMKMFTSPDQFSDYSITSSLSDICKAMPLQSILIYDTIDKYCPEEVRSITGVTVNSIEIYKISNYRTNIIIKTNATGRKQESYQSFWRIDSGLETFSKIIVKDNLNGLETNVWSGNVDAGNTVTISVPTSRKLGLLYVSLYGDHYEDSYIYTFIGINIYHCEIKQLDRYYYNATSEYTASFSQHSAGGERQKFDITNTCNKTISYAVRLLTM